jgi:hypothetical protein
MLTKIIILNSEIYSKAVIVLDRPSIQLVANNNTGKSSFINTLNFLFIIHERRMDFGDYEWKQTLNHYFPRFNESYILFEAYKSKTGYFCILVKRTEDNVDYYIVERDWNFLDKLFFKSDNELINFKDLQKALLMQGIPYRQVDKQELFDIVYSRDKRSGAVIWITDNVKRRGRSLQNSFTTVYRYLINSKLITPEALQEALIIADNRQNETLTVFADSGRKDDIIKLNQLKDEIEKLKAIQDSFLSFKELIANYNDKRKTTGELYFRFEKNYQLEERLILDKIEELKQAIEKTQYDIQRNLEPLKEKLNREIGALEYKIKDKQKKLEQKQKEEEEIKRLIATYASLEIALSTLDRNLENLNEKYKGIEFQLNSIKKYNLSQVQVERRLKKSKKERQNLQQQKNNFDNLLKHHISDFEDIRLILNALLSENVSNLPKERIIQPVTQLSNSLEVYDGKIDISDIEPQHFGTISELEEQIKDKEVSIAQDTEILEVIRNRSEKGQELRKIKGEIRQIERKLEKINKLEDIKTEIENIETDLSELQYQVQKKDRELQDVQSRIEENSQSLDEQRNQKNKLDNRQKNLKRWYIELSEEIENRGITGHPVTINKDDTIDNLYKTLRKNLNDISEFKGRIDEEFWNLKNSLDFPIADMSLFISEVDDRMAAISDKEKSIETLLENISNQFTTPVKNYLQRFNEFKSFIKNFNREISEYQVSNIEQIEIELKDNLRLIKDLEQISKLKKVINFGQISLFDEDQTEALSTLKHYLSKSEEYEFKRLFDIYLYLTINGKRKKVFLSRQVESEGTDKTLKLILFMLIMKRFVISNKENTIVVFVDEVLKIDDNNLSELIRFCEENNFLPICAAKSQAIGIEKFYFLQPSRKNQNKIFVDKEIQTAIAKRKDV